MSPQYDAGSVWHAFVISAGQFGERPFLRAPSKDEETLEYSYARTLTAATALGAGYGKRDLRIGDRVALAFDSRLDVYLHLLALNALGVSIVPLNSAATDDELRHIVGHSDANFIVSLPEHADRLRGLGICEVLLESDLAVDEAAIDAMDGDPNREAALLYTSGTTGKPKGCMLSNDYFLALGDWYIGLGGICSMDETDRLLTPLPPNHMNALCTSFTAMMFCGGCVIQLDRFHPRSWWQTARDEEATIIHCLGVMTAILLTLPEEPGDDFSSQIKFCFGPGSDPRHQGVFEKRFGVPLIEAWAMTESGAGGMTIAYEEPRHVGERCIGKTVPQTEHRIVDENDQDVAPGDPGELLVRARGDDPRRHFFSGYYKDDAATEEGWKGGWWHTGDVVREGEDGSLYFVDRRKNVIRRSGENIAAVEVEATLLRHEDVDGCAVCAVPDEIRGDEVFAFVINNKQVDAQDIFDHCMAHLTYFKVPGYIAFVPELPLTASQKVSRGDIKAMARASLENGDCIDLRESKRRTSS